MTRVPVHQAVGQFVNVEPGSTKGATVGVDLFFADGTVVTEDYFSQDAPSPTPATVGSGSGLGTMAVQNADSVAISGGSIDGTPIGAGTPSDGAFTDLSATGNTTLGDATGDTLTINAGTATTPNGLNFNSNQLVIGSTGLIAMGGVASSAVALYLRRDIQGGATAYGVQMNCNVLSSVTNTARGYYTSIGIDSGATPTNLRHFEATQGTFTGSATSQEGFFASSTLTGATNNRGFRGNIAAGSGRWNCYMDGTADNAFAGNTRFGGTTAPTVPVDVTGAILATTFIRSSGATSGIGYATGAGGTVTQATDKSTGVTLNKVSGQITMSAAALAADTTVTFTLTNSSIAAGDVLVLNHISGGTAGSYLLNAQSAAGSAAINVRNVSTGSLGEAIVIAFALIKAVTS